MAKRKRIGREARDTIITLLEVELTTHKARQVEADLEISRLEGAIAALKGGKSGNGRLKNGTSSRSRRRIIKRRSTAHLAKIAADVWKFIEAAGKDGVSGRDLQAKFGKLIPTPAKFLAHHDHKVRTTGAKTKMRYQA